MYRWMNDWGDQEKVNAQKVYQEKTLTAVEKNNSKWHKQQTTENMNNCMCSILHANLIWCSTNDVIMRYIH